MQDFLHFYYNNAGHINGVMDPAEEITEFRYDSNQNLVEIKNPLDETIEMDYNQFGQLTVQTDITGENEIQYIRDEINILVHIKLVLIIKRLNIIRKGCFLTLVMYNYK